MRVKVTVLLKTCFVVCLGLYSLENTAFANAPPAQELAGKNIAVWCDDTFYCNSSFNYTWYQNAIVNHLGNKGANVTVTTMPFLETAGYLDSFDAVIVTRAGVDFGSGLSSLAATNIYNYAVGGNNVTLNFDAFDMLDPSSQFPASTYDANIDKLVTNAVVWAAQNHGYVGEFSGAAMALTSNVHGWAPIGLFDGSGALGQLADGLSLNVLDATHPVMNGVITAPLSEGFVPGNTWGLVSSGISSQFILAQLNPPAVLGSGAGTPVPEIPAGMIPFFLSALSLMVFRVKSIFVK